MKKFLFTSLLIVALSTAYAQTTYYWVGGTGPAPIATAGNWNTLLDGTGLPRTTPDNADVLIFNGTNVGGTVPTTGQVTVTITGTTAGQLRLTGNANVVFTRIGGMTGTVTIGNGSATEDLFIDAGSSLSLNSATANGSVQMVFAPGASGKVFGALSESNTGSQRITNGAGTGGPLVFASGSTFTSNITASAASYPFGSNTQGSEKWVIFESGSSLIYEGGWSPMGNNSTYSAIDFKPGSNWYHRATNVLPSVFGSFTNNKSFGNIIVENNASLNADGPIYRIGNLTVNTGSTFTTHTSGQTVILGNLVINGTLTAGGTSTNAIVMGGNSPQSVSGSGTITVPNLVVADNSNVILNRNISVGSSTGVYGDINFNSNQLSGAGTFTARVNNTATGVTGTMTAGSYQITGVVGTLASLNGLTITGAGIPANTNVVGFSSGGATINLSQPITASGTLVPLTFSSDTATIAVSHPSGLDTLNGVVIVTGNKTFQSGTNYIINGATTWPFGVSSNSTNTYINAGFVEINAPVTVNRGVTVYDHLAINGKMTLRPLDTVRIANGATLYGTFNSNNYIATVGNSTTGVMSVLQYDGLSGAVTLPLGTSNYYLPLALNPTTTSDIVAYVFEGITTNGLINGTPLTPAQKQTVVNAVWNITRLSGTGNSDLGIGWNTALEGSTFTTLPGSDIGLITNNGSSWSLPTGTGDNTLNTISATISSSGSFSAGAVPPTQPFIFNPLPVKTYGDPDFNGGATSLNTTQPIVYSSNNTAVATIINGDIHITGAGTAGITATQASDGFYPAVSVTQTLTVNKAALTITADNKLKFEGQANPALTASYSGFVLGETAAVLTTPVTLTTTAVTASPAGAYPITASGATAANYTITFVNGTMTVQPRTAQTITFNALPVKTYGNADFAAGATSTNNTIPITYTSSNTSVATIIGSNIHIVGAGTSTITASQAGNPGYFPAADVSRTLTVNKAALTVRVRDTTKVEGQVNPQFTITYTGFVLGQTAANLTTAPSVNTIATTTSPAGYYVLTPEGAASNNYSFNYVAGRLTILPLSGADQQYLNAFMINGTTLNVRVYSVQPRLGNIVIYDLNGRPVLKKNLFMPAGFINNEMNVGALANGIYVVTVKGEGVDLKKTVPIMR